VQASIVVLPDKATSGLQFLVVSCRRRDIRSEPD